MASCVTELICVNCGESYRPSGPEMTCPACGPDDGILEIHFNLEKVAAAWHAEPLEERPLNHWRYRELLPLERSAIPRHWPVGWTPGRDRRYGDTRLEFGDFGASSSGART